MLLGHNGVFDPRVRLLLLLPRARRRPRVLFRNMTWRCRRPLRGLAALASSRERRHHGGGDRSQLIQQVIEIVEIGISCWEALISGTPRQQRVQAHKQRV